MTLLPMDMELLPPSDDRIFKLILTAPDSKPILIDLITAILKRLVADVVVRNNELPPGDTQEKAERFDVNCRLEDGDQVDLEMQASRVREDIDSGHRNLKGKSVYYICDLHASQPSKGVRRYDRLARTYQVTFCSYTVFQNRESYVNSFSLRHDEDNELFSDAIQIIYVELSKLDTILKKSVCDMTDLEKWAVFFRYASEPTCRETVNQVIASKEALQMAGNLLMSVSRDERERAVFRSRRMYETDRMSDLATAEETGARREKINIACNALQMNIPIDDIVKLTGLTRKEIADLQS